MPTDPDEVIFEAPAKFFHRLEGNELVKKTTDNNVIMHQCKISMIPVPTAIDTCRATWTFNDQVLYTAIPVDFTPFSVDIDYDDGAIAFLAPGFNPDPTVAQIIFPSSTGGGDGNPRVWDNSDTLPVPNLPLLLDGANCTGSVTVSEVNSESSSNLWYITNGEAGINTDGWVCKEHAYIRGATLQFMQGSTASYRKYRMTLSFSQTAEFTTDFTSSGEAGYSYNRFTLTVSYRYETDEWLSSTLSSAPEFRVDDCNFISKTGALSHQIDSSELGDETWTSGNLGVSVDLTETGRLDPYRIARA